MSPDRCTCRYGRDHDGSEFGACEWCEDAEGRELAEAFADGDPPTEDELEEAGVL